MRLTITSLHTHGQIGDKDLILRGILRVEGKPVGKVTKGVRDSEYQYIWGDQNAKFNIDKYANRRYSHLIENERRDALISDLIKKTQQNRIFEKNCKKKLIFRIKGDVEGEWRSLNCKYSSDAREFVFERYGRDKVEEILNERFL